jgi:hypothetical protein
MEDKTFLEFFNSLLDNKVEKKIIELLLQGNDEQRIIELLIEEKQKDKK